MIFNKLNFFISSLLIIVGIKIIYTKEIKQGNASMGNNVLHLGNYAYILGSIFILYGIYIAYKTFTSDEKRD